MDSLKEMFPSEILKSAKDSDWEDIMVNGRKAIEEELGWHRMEEKMKTLYSEIERKLVNNNSR